MALRTATESTRLSWAPKLLEGTDLDHSARRRDHPAPTFAPLAVVWLCLAFLGAMSGAFKAGRLVERGQEFGQLVALQALEPEMRQAAQKCGAEAQRLASLGVVRPRIPPAKPPTPTLAPDRLPVTPQKVAAPVGQPTQIHP